MPGSQPFLATVSGLHDRAMPEKRYVFGVQVLVRTLTFCPFGSALRGIGSG